MFLDALEMCHRIDLSRRLDAPGPALAPAGRLSDHELSTGGNRGIDVEYVAALTASD